MQELNSNLFNNIRLHQWLWLLVFGTLLALPACNRSSQPPVEEVNLETLNQSGEAMELREAIKAAAAEWLKINGVEGVAAGKQEGEYCILVSVSQPAERFKEKIPETYAGYPVVIRQSGKFKAN